MLNNDDVAEILQGELTRRGWMTRDVQDIGVIDPAANAKIVGFEDEALLNDIRTEMSDALTATADFFRDGTPAE